jgi:hypothetical protein
MMLHLPREIMQVLRPFAQAFSDRIWDWVQLLLVDAIVTPRRGIVTAICSDPLYKRRTPTLCADEPLGQWDVDDARRPTAEGQYRQRPLAPAHEPGSNDHGLHHGRTNLALGE